MIDDDADDGQVCLVVMMVVIVVLLLYCSYKHSSQVPLISLDNSSCHSTPGGPKNERHQVWPNIVKRTFQNINIRPRQHDQENQLLLQQSESVSS